MYIGFPDVWLTPAGPAVVPVPYPNVAMGPTAIPKQMTVFIMAMPAHNLGTTIPRTNGDNVR
ncbi:MAG: PAAR-like domain-containing protein [Acetobacteraceae bacterium]